MIALAKPRDSQTADLEGLRSYGFLNKIPYSRSQKSIYPDGVLTEALLRNYNPPSIINPPRGRARYCCLHKPGKGNLALEAQPLIGKALDSKAQH